MEDLRKAGVVRKRSPRGAMMPRPRIPFGFFARILLVTLSAVFGILSFTTRAQLQELAYAAASIACALLIGTLRKKSEGGA